MTAAEIAKKVGCTVALVYNIKAKSAEASTAKGNRGRKPASTKAASGDLNSILTAVKNAEMERLKMRAALEKISAVINDALA